jgi:CheY-like chemotaxis protein
MRTFARTEPSASTAVDLDRVVGSALAMAMNEIRHRAKLTTKLGAPPLASGNEATLVPVVLNLLVNAAHAIPEGHAECDEIMVTTGVDPSGRLFIEVSDTGAGMSAQTMKQIFDPFFTTKSVGHGMGLGLSLAHATIAACGGEITVASTLGEGSRFRVLLPPATPDVVAPAAASSTPPPTRSRILIVDDEAPVAHLLRRVLGKEHDVVIAASGGEALATLRADPGFDAILCDVMMPDLTGADVHRTIELESPALARRFVFVSGGAFGERARAYVDATKQPMVVKPFERAQVLRAVREITGLSAL